LIEHGICHRIGTYISKNSIENKGLFMLVYNRVGMIPGLAMAGIY
jgi:hypothetical protein